MGDEALDDGSGDCSDCVCVNGTDGKDGKDGKDGQSIEGPRGPPGPPGLNGAPGADGQNGADGSQGPRGEKVCILTERTIMRESCIHGDYNICDYHRVTKDNEDLKGHVDHVDHQGSVINNW